jgi:hypothetical protein
MPPRSLLSVIVDDAALPDEEARAFWKRFSAYMDANKGDLAGFAKQEGFTSVVPETGPDGARLRASRTALQPVYANAKPAR